MDAITREEMFLSDAAGESNFELEPITRKEILLKKIAESGGGGGGVSSWNDLTDKPFGEKTEELVTILEETEVTEENAQSLPLIDLVAGEKYIVTWNGENISVTAKEINADAIQPGMGMVAYLGNGVLFGLEDTGEPFIIVAVKAVGITMATPTDSSISSVTVKIEKTEKTYTKIPKEFLPDGYPYIDKSAKITVLEEIKIEANTSGNPPSENIAYVDIVAGETYDVTWNGRNYSCVAKSTSIDGIPLVGIGNWAAIGETNSGEPFLIGSGADLTQVVFLDGSTSATVKIVKSGEKIIKLDPKFLPGTYIFKDVFTADELSGGAEISKSFDASPSDFDKIIAVYKDGGKFIIEAPSDTLDNGVLRYYAYLSEYAELDEFFPGAKQLTLEFFCYHYYAPKAFIVRLLITNIPD